MSSTVAPATSAQPKAHGFGFQPDRSQHHFVVSMPTRKDDKVTISEHFALEEFPEKRALSLALGQEDNKVRAILPSVKWEPIAEAVKTEFNTRLRKRGLPAGKWSRPETPL